jgi:predicted ABC-type ATPase
MASAEEALARVAARVAQGGHHVPDEVVRRRFFAGLENFENIYRQEVDFWRRYDNSGDMLRLIDEGDNDEPG